MPQLAEEITGQDLKGLLSNASDITLIDVRELWEVETCRIKGSLHMPLSRLAIEPPDLNKDRPIVIYCHMGIRSLSAAIILRQMGFTNVANLKGGIDSWSRQIDASIPTY